MGNKSILVVGGAGYIGSQVVADLVDSGYQPTIYDNFCTGNRDIAASLKVPVIEGDLADRPFLESTLSKLCPDAVMHFAAFAYVGESVTSPLKYYRNNFANALNLVEAMVKCDVNRLIFSSTCATYGVPSKLPITEDTPQNPINPYGQTKLMVEKMLADTAAATKLRYVAFRYFNAAGAHPTRTMGERHDPETHLLPLAILAALGHGKLQVFGTDYDTPDGTCIRDYIHIADISQAHIKGVEYLLNNGSSDVFNIGNGQGYSVKEVLDTVALVTGNPVPHTLNPRRPGDPPRLVAHADKLKRVLGWKPGIPELHKIVADAVRWHKHELARDSN